MSYKTDRLIDLFPDIYSAGEKSSLLYYLLDALGAELLQIDEGLKQLLKSHWVDYASGPALDGLGQIYGVERRRLSSDQDEPDEIFRQRLKSIVDTFTGGGTQLAIKGAVRSALGLPFNLKQLNLPDGLSTDLEALVKIVEFSPKSEYILDKIADPANAGELVLNVKMSSVLAVRAMIEWTFTKSSGSGLKMVCENTNLGLQTDPNADLEHMLVIDPGQTLYLSSQDSSGALLAVLDGKDVTRYFTSLDGNAPVMPEVPMEPSRWRFTVDNSARMDLSTFDEDTFDSSWFDVKMVWQHFKPLTFDVYVPYFFQDAVDEMKKRNGYPGEISVYKSLDHKTIQSVVDQVRAAGVEGNVHFLLSFSEDAGQVEAFHIEGVHHTVEPLDAEENLTYYTGFSLGEDQAMDEVFVVGGVFDVARYDESFGFVE